MLLIKHKPSGYIHTMYKAQYEQCLYSQNPMVKSFLKKYWSFYALIRSAVLSSLQQRLKAAQRGEFFMGSKGFG